MIGPPWSGSRGGQGHDSAADIHFPGEQVRTAGGGDFPPADFGILRLIVSNNELAEKILKEKGFTVGKTDVVAIEVPDKPGGLAEILAALGQAGINVEYMYAFVAKSHDNAVVIFRFDDLLKAIDLLRKNGVKVLPGEKVYNL